MRLGLVGLPQVGKRTLFELLTGQATGPDRSEGIFGLAAVRDERFDRLVSLYDPDKRTPAQINFVLLPDLDLEANRNRSLFDMIERIDVICYVARAFVDDTVFHVSGDVDASRDVAQFAEELQLADLILIEKRLERIEKDIGKRIDADAAAKETVVLTRMRAHLEVGKTLVSLDLTEEEYGIVGSYPFMTTKPVVVVVNVGEDDIRDTKKVEEARAGHQERDFRRISVSARVEQEIEQLESTERGAFLGDLGIERAAIDQLTLLCYDALGLISFFTVGEDEVRAWTIRRGSTAPQAGRAIHKDIERGFIRSEVMTYDDLVGLGSEQKVKESGKLMQKGKDHVVEDGEIHHFLFKV